LRYIKGTSDAALCYGGSESTVRGYVDSDFTGDLEKRKSTTGYVATQFLTHVLIFFQKNPKIEKNIENPKIYFF
jgi:hypothetical protein